MKILKILLLIIPLWLCLSVSASAADIIEDETTQASTDQSYASQLEAVGADGLKNAIDPETYDLMGKLGAQDFDYNSIINISPANVFGVLTDIFTGKAKSPLRSCAAVLGVILLCAVLDGMKLSFNEKSMNGAIGVVSALAVGSAVIIPALGCISHACSAVQASGALMLVFIPVYGALLAASGNPAAALGYGTWTFAMAQGISYVSSNYLAPLTNTFLAFCVTGTVSPALKMRGIAETVKKTVSVALGLLATVFVGMLSINSVVAAAADNIGMRTAKFAVSNFMPVVGGAVSEALTAVQGSMGLLKSTVGAWAIAAIALTYLPAAAELLVWQLTLQICAAVSDVFSLGNITSILKSVQTALSLLLIILITCMMALIISVGIMLTLKGG